MPTTFCETEPPEKLELDKAWRRLAALLHTAGVPVNPITGGSPFPDAESAWDDAYALTPTQVADAATTLAGMPFSELEAHLGAVLEAEDWTNFDDDPASPTFMRSLPGPVVIPDQTVRNIQTVLAARYAELVPFLPRCSSKKTSRHLLGRLTSIGACCHRSPQTVPVASGLLAGSDCHVNTDY